MPILVISEPLLWNHQVNCLVSDSHTQEPYYDNFFLFRALEFICMEQLILKDPPPRSFILSGCDLKQFWWSLDRSFNKSWRGSREIRYRQWTWIFSHVSLNTRTLESIYDTNTAFFTSIISKKSSNASDAYYERRWKLDGGWVQNWVYQRTNLNQKRRSFDFESICVPFEELKLTEKKWIRKHEPISVSISSNSFD